MKSNNMYRLQVSCTLLLIVGVVAQQQLQKPGSCAPPTGVGICANVCKSDYDCSGANKCCRTTCGGTVCAKPVTMNNKPSIVKPGSCPVTPDGPWVCSNRCSVDSDCRGRLKCCKNRCGAMACMKAEGS